MLRKVDTKKEGGGGVTRLNKKQAQALGILQIQKSKYHSRMVEVDGHIFDSKKEAQKYIQLKLWRQAGVIKDFELQPEFELQPGYRDRFGRWVHPIKYRADFRVIYPDGRAVIIDTKGYRTKDYRLKRKMLLYRYPDIEFVEE